MQPIDVLAQPVGVSVVPRDVFRMEMEILVLGVQDVLFGSQRGVFNGEVVHLHDRFPLLACSVAPAAVKMVEPPYVSPRPDYSCPDGRRPRQAEVCR